MHITQCLHDTGNRLYFVYKTLIQQPRIHRIQQRSLSNLWLATKQPPHFECKILLHNPFRLLGVRVWFDVDPDIAVVMLPVTLFIDRFICSIFASEHKAISWYYYLVAILSTNHYLKPTSSQRAALISVNKLSKHVDELPIPIRIAHQVVLETHILHSVLATALVSGTHAVKPRTQEKNMQMVSATYSVIGSLSSQPFHVFLSNFSTKAMPVPKQMVVACATDPPTAMMTAKSSSCQQSLIGTLENVDKYAYSDSDCDESNTNVASGEEKYVTYNIVGAAHHNPSTNRRSQLRQNLRIDQKKTTQPSGKWRKEVTKSARYQAYWQPFNSMLSEFQSMWNDHLGGNMRAENITDSVQTKWAAPIIIVVRKDRALRFCVHYRKLNAITKRDSYSIPRIDERINSLGQAIVSSTLDANSGYLQIQIGNSINDDKAFTTDHGLLRSTRVPFRLCNAPGTCLRAMNVIHSSIT